ncbi:MAG: class D beta-lactamase [Cytophagaceae bacterium]|nr:class D beta-lactamase [Cytophagaceae bacterium]
MNFKLIGSRKLEVRSWIYAIQLLTSNFWLQQLRKAAFLFSFLLISITSFSQDTVQYLSGLDDLFEEYHVEGSFSMIQLDTNTVTLYDDYEFRKYYSPASTFKILNSLIALETKVLKDENTVIKWDSIERWVPAWNKDQDMKTAFSNSTVWFYQEVARRVGGKKMKYWLNKAQYGNMDTTGGIDHFWLTGGLRITPEQQLNFLKKLYLNQLPFSKKNMEIVKRIMIREQTDTYTLRGKTGWGYENYQDIGWFVGYLETNGKVYFFATCLQNTEENNENFPAARIEITKQILRRLKLLL